MRNLPVYVKMKYRMLRRLSEIWRWAVVPVLRRQNVAEHSFHVTCIARLVADDHAILRAGNFRRELLEYCLDHDEDESISGDSPSNYKRWLKKKNTVGGLKPTLSPDPVGIAILDLLDIETSAAVKHVAKIADIIEALTYISEEEAMGNQRLGHIRADIWLVFIKEWEAFLWNGPNKPRPEDYLALWSSMYDPAIHPGLEFTNAY